VARPKKNTDEEGAPAYMAQFCDMITQLVTFFIILLSMSHQQVSGFHAGMGSIREFFGRAGAIGSLTRQKRRSVLHYSQATFPINEQEAADSDVVAVARRIYVADEGDFGDVVEARYKQSTISVQMPDDLLFDPGQASLKPEARRYLDRIISVFRDQSHLIIVNGYADDSPRSPTDDAYGWLLSAHRANSVVQYMHNTGSISYKRLFAIGHGNAGAASPDDAPKNARPKGRIEMTITKPGRDRWTR